MIQASREGSLAIAAGEPSYCLPVPRMRARALTNGQEKGDQGGFQGSEGVTPLVA